MKRISVVVSVAALGFVTASSTPAASGVPAPTNVRPSVICDCGGGTALRDLIRRLVRRNQSTGVAPHVIRCTPAGASLPC